MILAGVAVVSADTLLIVGLLVHRARRTRAEQALAERAQFDGLLARLSRMFIDLSLADIDATIQRALRHAIDELGVDRATLLETKPGGGPAFVTHCSAATGVDPVPNGLELNRFPWTNAQLRRRQTVHFSRLAELPTDQLSDREGYARFGTRSLAVVPLIAEDVMIGALSFSSVSAERIWSQELLGRLHLMGEIFASALVRRRTEAALRESEERFRLMADSAPVMVWMSGPDMSWTYCNRSWLEFVGRDMETQLGDGWSHGIAPEDVKPALTMYRGAFAQRTEIVIEYRVLRHDGEYRRILDKGVPRFAPDGTFAGYIGSCIDVTELRAAEQALIESKTLGAAIFASFAGNVAAIDRQGLIIAVNEGWVHNATEQGVDPKQVSVGASYVDECRRAAQSGDIDAQRALEAIEAVLADRRPRATIEYSFADSPDRRWFEMVVERLKRPEGGAVIAHLDITSRRVAEDEARRHLDELAHAQRLMISGELGSSLAHELNQPLLAIMSNAHAVRRLLDVNPPDLPEVREAVGDIADEALRAGEVIRSLRAMVSKGSADRRLLDLNELIAGVAQLTRGNMDQREIKVALRLSTNVPIVLADAVQMRQVMLNLFLNGCDAMAGIDGTRALHVHTFRTDEGDAHVTLRDTGEGVAADADLERIFERFVTTKPHGLGLGLSISRSIVENHGGRIWAIRNVGPGLTLHVVIPAAGRGAG